MWRNDDDVDFIPPPPSDDYDGEEQHEEERGSAPMETADEQYGREEARRSFQGGEPSPWQMPVELGSSSSSKGKGKAKEMYNPCLIPARAYRFRPSKKAWKHNPASIRANKKPPSSVRIITWNIDAYASELFERANMALRTIAAVLGCKSVNEEPEPCCILLQEVNQQVMPHILEHEWIQRYFQICPISAAKWPSQADFGNVTLISRSIEIVKSDILDFRSQSPMARMGVITHIRMRVPDPTPRIATIRIINTHLESLPEGESWRPIQLGLLKEVLSDGDFTDGGIIAGDLNAIGATDANLARAAGLKDAWKRGDTDESGFTWGYQGPDAGRFLPGRLDKILFLPHKGYEVDEPRRFGVGKTVKPAGGQKEWVSDHFGLKTTLRMVH